MTECKDRPQEGEADYLQCPTCRGTGCSNCKDGFIELTKCHNVECREMIDVASLIELFENGLPPVAGGSLDQTAWFLDAARELKTFNAEYKLP